MKCRADRRGVISEGKNATRKCRSHTRQPQAQCAALRGRASLQRQNAFFQFQDRDGRQEKPRSGLLFCPSTHFGLLVGLALAKLGNHIGIQNEH